MWLLISVFFPLIYRMLFSVALAEMKVSILLMVIQAIQREKHGLQNMI